MNANTSPSLINGISKGFYRISQVITASILVGGAIYAYTENPWISKTYRLGLLESTGKSVEECTDGDIREYASSYSFKTPKGHSVHITLCFETLSVIKNGQTFNYLPYTKDDKGYWYIETSPSKYGNDLSSKYLYATVSKFQAPIKDMQEIDSGYWKLKLESIWEAVKATALALLGWAIFYSVIRFIWRGFTNRD
jgi:hypothetical protein